MMADTLLLDTLLWDIVLDASGNIALAADPYSQAQDAASAIRLFSGELWYNTALGIDYFGQILGKTPPPLSLYRAGAIQSALTVPGVVAAQVFFNGLVDRLLTGQVQIANSEGLIGVAKF